MKHLKKFNENANEDKIRKLIDNALDIENYAEVARLSKLLHNKSNSEIEIERLAKQIAEDPNEREYEESEEEEDIKDCYIFSIYMDEEDSFATAINPKSYWDEHKCLIDDHQSYDLEELHMLPDGFGEACEATFEYDYNGDLEDGVKSAITKLVNSGFKFNKEFQLFCENSTDSYGDVTIDGLSVSEYISKQYPNILV